MRLLLALLNLFCVAVAVLMLIAAWLLELAGDSQRALIAVLISVAALSVFAINDLFQGPRR